MLKLYLGISLIVVVLGKILPNNEENAQTFIIGGTETDISDIPYQVALYKRGRFLCGGSVVAQNLVITAAHCVNKYYVSDIDVRAGSSFYESDGVMVAAKDIYVHQNYTPMKKGYDVSLIELQKPLKFSNTIKPIEFAKTEPKDGIIAKASGWGHQRMSGEYSKKLRSVLMPIVNRKVCEKAYKPGPVILESMVCAGAEGKDTCFGDSGGPLAVDGKLVGVVSFGLGCGDGKYPGVYTSISHPEIQSFIKKYLKN